MLEVLTSDFSIQEESSILKCTECSEGTWEITEPTTTERDRCSWASTLQSIRRHVRDSIHSDRVIADERKRKEASDRSELVKRNLIRLILQHVWERHSYRSIESAIVTAHDCGMEVGDLNHSKNRPPQIIECGYDLLLEKLAESFREQEDRLGFPPPFSVTMDKDQSKGRKRMVLLLKCLDLTEERTLSPVYMAAPSATDHSEPGLAQLSHEVISRTISTIGSGNFRGGSVDGAVVGVHYHQHLARILNQPTESIIWIWDGSHLVQLAFDRVVEGSCELRRAHEALAAVTAFFRETRNYEVALEVGDELGKTLKRPKLAKSLKFVQHDMNVTEDFWSNFTIYQEALERIVDQFGQTERGAEAKDHLEATITSANCLANLRFMCGVVSLLTRVSLSFQKSQLRVDQYLNNVAQLKVLVSTLNLDSPSEGMRTVFREYFNILEAWDNVEGWSGNTRTRSGDVRDELLRVKQHHVQFLKKLKEAVYSYFFEADRWNGKAGEKRENISFLLGAGSFLGHLTSAYGPPTNLFPEMLPDFEPHAPYSLHLLGRLTTSSITPDDVAQVERALKAKKERHFPLDEALRQCILDTTLPRGVREVTASMLAISASEAVCETYGSVLEGYHRRRFFGLSDVMCQKEVFLQANMPPPGKNESFVRELARRCPFSATNEAYRGALGKRYKTSSTIHRFKSGPNTKPGLFRS